ncbi:MAG: tRNA pseudouridine(38-40) synthase TruA [Candidatus Kapaibacterium sp.]|nr:tRNA pseudouridine(38-40) synthase TruA [Bacteroidota bacterium]
MSTIVLCVAFDGTNYCGMQTQPNGSNIQDELEKAIKEVSGVTTQVVAAGRTDSGVHAQGMVVHVRVEDWRIPQESTRKALNSVLPDDIVITGAQLRDDNVFHARFDAVAREYSYTITTVQNPLTRLYAWYPRIPFDTAILQQSAEVFLGEHDFTTFSKLNADTNNHVCDVTECWWQVVNATTVQLHIKANRFVYGMVRSVVGTMMDVARGKRTNDEVRLALEKKDRVLNSPIAPAHGLVFEKAYYPEALAVNFV